MWSSSAVCLHLLFIYSTIDREDEDEKDFYETHCHWVGCDKGDFGTQEQLVRVRRNE